MLPEERWLQCELLEEKFWQLVSLLSRLFHRRLFNLLHFCFAIIPPPFLLSELVPLKTNLLQLYKLCYLTSFVILQALLFYKLCYLTSSVI
jgi:hypothetical protein